MSGSQHRCVFVGNIPYDATEEQLIQICEEVGPVVSFRLVVDRETGKPKGYGFCEFRDEETAASARRNLKGYEINGRPLRVDIAANEKGGSGDRSREQGLQGRGGPGLPSTNFPVDNQKPALPFGGGAAEQPIGYAAAAAAAAVMAGALGSSHHVSAMAGQGQNVQQGTQMNGHGSGVLPGNDALTSHLASMSKQQLYGIMSQMKALIQQNQQQARQILVANPQLTKALFQAQIMLGMVRPPQTSQVHAGQQAPLPPPQPMQSQSQTQGPQPPTMPSQPFMYSQQSSSLPQSQLHPPLPQQPRPPVPPPVPPPMPPHLQSAQNLGFQPSPPQQLSFQHGVPQFSMGMAYPPQAQPPLPPQPPPQLQSQQIYQSMMANSASRMATDLGGSTSHAQGGLSTSAGILGSGLGVGPQGQAQHIRGPGMGPASGPLTGAVGLSSGNMDSVGGSGGERNFPNVPPMGSSNPYGQPPSPLIQAMGLEQQKALLQQVMKLTPEQIESLPSEHRQQVLQLQQALNLKL